MVEINDTKVLFLAIWLHETYEAQAREVGWKTQESCRVKFDELPEANKKVMLKIARDIAYNLEANKEEGRVEGAIGQLKEEVDFLRRFVDGYVYLDEVHQRYLDKIRCLRELESKGVN